MKLTIIPQARARWIRNDYGQPGPMLLVGFSLLLSNKCWRINFLLKTPPKYRELAKNRIAPKKACIPAYPYYISWISYSTHIMTTMAKPMKTLELHYPMIQCLIASNYPYPTSASGIIIILLKTPPKYREDWSERARVLSIWRVRGLESGSGGAAGKIGKFQEDPIAWRELGPTVPRRFLGCLPFVRINRLGRALNNGKSFSKISKPTERNGAYHLHFDFQ